MLAGLRAWPISLLAALAMVASFALEGHTVSHDGDRWLPALLIILHLAVVHWWLGALFPLRAATRAPREAPVAGLVAQFGKHALIAVAVLVAAGGFLIAILAGWDADLKRNHQVVFIIKLLVFAAILAMAAINKLWWTPMLASHPDKGSTGLRRTLNIEILLCGVILLVTAMMTSFSPAEAA